MADKIVFIGKYFGHAPALDGLVLKPARVEAYHMPSDSVFRNRGKDHKKLAQLIKQSFHRAEDVHKFIEAIFPDYDEAGVFLKITIERRG